MLFHQGDAGWENSGKGEKQTSEDGSVTLSQKSGDHGDRATKEESHGILVPFCFRQRGEINLNGHRFIAATPRAKLQQYKSAMRQLLKRLHGRRASGNA